MTASRAILPLLLVSLAAPSSDAQHLAPIALRARDAAPTAHVYRPAAAASMRVDLVSEPEDPEVSTIGTIIGGIGGGVVGGLAGLQIGASSTHDCQGDFCGLQEALIGFALGESVGLAIGSHLGSRSRRHENVILTSLSSAGILVAGVAAAVGLGGRAGGTMLLATPVLQLAAAVAIERP